MEVRVLQYLKATSLITIALFGLGGFAMAQKPTTDKEGNDMTTVASARYGSGGSHVTASDKNFKLVWEKYYDKCGRLREECTYDKTGKEWVRTYYTPKGNDVVIVKSKDGVESYTDYYGDPLSKEKGEALVKKWESTPSPPPPCPEKPGAAQPKVRPEAPSGEVSPPLVPSTKFAPPKFNWAGFYAGIEGNYTRGSSDFTLMPTGRWNDFPDLSFELAEHGWREFNRDGYGIGGYAGYNFMLCEHFLFGVEVAGRRIWGLADSFATGDFDFNRNGMFDVKQRIDTPYLVTFGPRVGYGCGKFLPYVNGGLAFGEVDAHQAILTSTFGGNTTGKESSNQVGWFVGGGVEYALTDNWRLRIGYQYTDLSTLDFMGSGHPDTFHGFNSWNSVHVTEHTGTFGLGYSFPSFGR